MRFSPELTTMTRSYQEKLTMYVSENYSHNVLAHLATFGKIILINNNLEIFAEWMVC